MCPVPSIFHITFLFILTQIAWGICGISIGLRSLPTHIGHYMFIYWKGTWPPIKDGWHEITSKHQLHYRGFSTDIQSYWHYFTINPVLKFGSLLSCLFRWYPSWQVVIIFRVWKEKKAVKVVLIHFNMKSNSYSLTFLQKYITLFEGP